jgi:hypothetical protein
MIGSSKAFPHGPYVTRAKAAFASELKILALRVKTKHTVEFDLWIQNLL